ncbi:MAG TPA: glycosyltransferase 87 family protein [Verrucomicrobiae bacterium]|nr:glycosyltransferase 87 family protein [Verrucomicrobiae bacterium]
MIRRWNSIAADVRSFWSRRGISIVRLAAVVICFAAIVRLYKGVRDLLEGTSQGNIPDVFTDLIPRWFAGLSVYSYSPLAVHPPATYVMLWPFFGWLEATPARWLWTALEVAALAWLVLVTVREGGGEERWQRIFLACLPVCTYATKITLSKGQFVVFLLPMLITAVLLVERRAAGWKRDSLVFLLLLLTLSKPPIAALFMWIVLFLPGGARPIVFVTAVYALLTLFGLSFSTQDLSIVFQDWQARTSALALNEGSTNLHRLLSRWNLGGWIFPASCLVFALHGWWVHRHRRVDPWLLMGVTAVVARFWTYHRQYDDLLIVLPAITLFRLAKKTPRDGADVAAALLFSVIVAGSLVPLSILSKQLVWGINLSGVLARIWVVMLAFLLWESQRERLAPAELRVQGNNEETELPLQRAI